MAGHVAVSPSRLGKARHQISQDAGKACLLFQLLSKKLDHLNASTSTTFQMAVSQIARLQSLKNSEMFGCSGLTSATLKCLICDGLSYVAADKNEWHVPT